MHVMIDLETAGLQPTALILTIGMVWFDPTKGDVSQNPDDRIHIALDYNQLREIGGFTEDLSTHEWWAKQSKAVHEKAWGGERTNVFLAAGFVKGFLMRHPLDGLWGNGAAFDNAVMRNFYAMLRRNLVELGYPMNIPPEWVSHKLDMCYRTLRALYISSVGEMFATMMGMPEFEGEEHDALANAIYQARCAQAMMQQLGMFQS